MDVYEYRRQIQKIYNDSIYGNTKGDIYNELSDLRIDNEFVEGVKCDQKMRTIMFQLSENVTDRDVSSLLSQIKLVIKEFVNKNISDGSKEFEEFLNSDLCYDSYKLNNNIIVQI